MQLSASELANNLRRVEERIADAAARVGRDPADVTLVTVTKTRSLDEVRAVIEAGAMDLGENYAQELEAKAEALADAKVRWHAIGHVQTNKVRKLVGLVHLVHSVDSLRLAEEIDRRAAAAGRQVPVLLQVNVSGEESKFGLAPEVVLPLAREVAGMGAARLAGLMTMPPYSADPEDSRPHFVALRELRDRLVSAGVPADRLHHLSMGMTGDFEVAVEEGATLVRVGTAIFGPRG